MNNPLNDKEFLYILDKQKNHTNYVRITAFSHDEKPLQQIEGRATGGSVNIDGSSAVRRTCSLTLVSTQDDIINAHWALKNKFKLEIGVKNTTMFYTDHPIIWFKMGMYGINSFSKNKTTTGVTINISGQDKMCFLNGTLGGTLTSSINFGEEDIINDDETITLKKIPIKDIIKKAVHTYANEPMHNIIITDLDDRGYELWDFKGGSKEFMYIFYIANSNKVFNLTFGGDMGVYYNNKVIKLSDIPDNDLYYRSKISENKPKEFSLSQYSNNKYWISKIAYGESAGFFQTDLVYAGDLISNAGSTLTQMLDNIIKMLGDYEYFYDIDGRFIFQKKKNYINGLVSFDGTLPIVSLPIYSYKFDDEELMTQMSITPTIADVKNDIAVWGSKKSLTGATLSPLGRVAIQSKPTEYTSFNGVKYTSQQYDWRELIYQMAKDYMEHHDELDYEARLRTNNYPLYASGQTKYEQYYTDILGFWRQLYWKEGLDEPNIVNFSKEDYLSSGWHKNKEYSPESLMFWFDLLEPNGGLKNYSIEQIGDRTKAEKNSSATSIYLKETPDILFKIQDNNSSNDAGSLDLTIINISQEIADNVFSMSSQGKSVLQALDELVYKHALLAEGVNITCIPIYHIEPNTRIYLKNMESDYIVSQMSIPLAYNGTMSITATKVIPYLN